MTTNETDVVVHRQPLKASSSSDVQQRKQQQKSEASVSLLAKSLNYPSPVPPSKSKSKIFRSEDFSLIDAHALSVPDALLHQSTENLLQYLCPSPLSELARLRSIYRWMTSSSLEDMVVSGDQQPLPSEAPYSSSSEALQPQPQPPQTPLDHLRNISSQTTNYAAVFTQLARSVGLRCLTIHGMTKSSAYSVGDTVDRKRMQGQWNAVHVSGHWRLIDVYWTMTATTRPTRGDTDPAATASQSPWTRIQLHDRDTAAVAPHASSGDDHHPSHDDGGDEGEQQQPQTQRAKVFNEFFFLPNPDQFVLTHLPDEGPWQLVDRNRIWTTEKFSNYFYVRERFFELDMRLIASSRTNCVIETIEGKTVVVFGLPSKRSMNYRFTYVMFRHKTDYDPSARSLLFERYLLFRKTKDRIELEISCPVTGRFLLNIYGQEMGKDKDFSQLCSYVIYCRSAAANAEPLPECPDIGWGAGTELEAVGVAPKSHTKPFIETKNGELEIEFEAVDLKAALLHLLSDEVDEWHGARHGILTMWHHHHRLHNLHLLLPQQQSRRKKQTACLSIKLQLPKPGIYAVKLFATNHISEGDIPNVLNYLVKYPDDASSSPSVSPPPTSSLSFHSPSSPSLSSPSRSSSSSSCKPFPLIHEGIVGPQYLSTLFSVTASSSTSDLQRIVKTSEGKVDVVLTHGMDEAAQLLFHLNSIDLMEMDLVDNCSLSLSSDHREMKLSLNLPQSGLYALNVFIRLSRQDDSIHVVHTQLIQSTTQKTPLPVRQGRQSSDEEDENRGRAWGMAVRRGLVTEWSSSLMNVWMNGLRVSQVITVYRTPVVFATTISDHFEISVPPGDHPLLAELQKETTISFPQSHLVSKVLRTDCELFSFQVPRNGVYRIDFYECLASGALVHLATYSITRRNSNAQELKELEGATEPHEDTSTTPTEQQQQDLEEAAVIVHPDPVDDKQLERVTPAVTHKHISKEEAATKTSEARKSSQRSKSVKPVKREIVADKKEDEVPAETTIHPTTATTEAKTDDTSLLQSNESESKVGSKEHKKEEEETRETEEKVEETQEAEGKVEKTQETEGKVEEILETEEKVEETQETEGKVEKTQETEGKVEEILETEEKVEETQEAEGKVEKTQETEGKVEEILETEEKVEETQETEGNLEETQETEEKMEETQETEGKVKELTEEAVVTAPLPPIIIEEYKSKTSLQEISLAPLQEDISTESVLELENSTVESEMMHELATRVSLKETAMKFIPRVFRKKEKQTVKARPAKDLKSVKESESEAKRKLSAQKLHDERKLLESSLRAKLEESMRGRDAESIQQVLDEIKSKDVTLRGDITAQAAKRIECLLMADKLRKAVTARDLELLRQLVSEAKKKKLRSGMEDEMKTAEEVIDRLEMIRRLTQMIADMDRQLVAEVKSYLNPRPPVYNVIAATFMLLGERQDNIKDWKSVQHLFIKSGSDSLKQRVNTFDLKNIDISVAIAAENLFRSYKRHEVERISTGIAIFYDWNANVVEEVKSLYVQSGGSLHQVRGYQDHPPVSEEEPSQQQRSSSNRRRPSPPAHRVPFPVKSEGGQRLLALAPTQEQKQIRRPSASPSAPPHRPTTAEQQQRTDHRRLPSASSSADRGSQSRRRRTSLSPSSAADQHKTKKPTAANDDKIRRHLSPASLPSEKQQQQQQQPPTNKRPPSTSSAASSDRSSLHPPSSPQQQQQQGGRRRSSDSRRPSASSTSSSQRATKKVL